MNDREREIIRTIVGALNVPRDRLGRLDQMHGQEANERLRQYGLELGLPHGGLDRIDKATMILQALCGDPLTSINDQ